MVGVTAAELVEQPVEVPALHAGHGQDHLGQQVQRAEHGAGLLDILLPHRLGHKGRFQHVQAVQGMQHPQAGLPHGVAGPADALQGGGHREGGLDQEHLVQLPDVDAQLQGAGGHDGLQLAALEAPLHGGPDLARQAAVVGVGQDRALRLVDQAGQLLRVPAGVGEQQGGAVGVDGRAAGGHQPRPDGGVASGRYSGRRRGRRIAHRQLQPLGLPGLQHRHFSRRVAGFPAGAGQRGLQSVSTHEGGHARRRLHRGRKGQALELPGQRHQPLHRGGQVRAALGGGHGVDLVQDHGAQARQDPAGPRGGEQQVQALRGGDQDFRRVAQHALALALRGVAAAHLHPHLGHAQARGGQALPELPQGTQQVGPDVGVQGLERRNVQHRGLAPRPGAGQQAVQGPQEGAEGLAAARGRGGQHVPPGGDHRPGQRLDLRGLPVGLLEPGPDDRVEQLQHCLITHNLRRPPTPGRAPPPARARFR